MDSLYSRILNNSNYSDLEELNFHILAQPEIG